MLPTRLPPFDVDTPYPTEIAGVKYEEVFERLAPGGAFCNLEHVASATASLHDQFLKKLGIAAGEEDPSNKLLDVETQLSWLRQIGFVDVDCHWKWRELALLAGMKPST